MGRALHNLSGGLDSTFTAWKWLLEHPERLLIHHCRLVTKQHRYPNEAEAVDRILQWFRDHGLGHFDFIETGFDYGTSRAGVYDIEVIGFMNAVVLRGKCYKDVDTILVSASENDMNLRNISVRQERREAVIRLMNPEREVTFAWPIKHLSREAMTTQIPPDLYALTWSCRRPRNGEPCGTCHACRNRGERRNRGTPTLHDRFVDEAA